MLTGDEERRFAIAGRIKEARKLAGLSQGQVAQLLGLHRPSVSEIESGNRRVSADELQQLSKLFDVSVAWLLGDVSNETGIDDPRVLLAARELAKLKPRDLEQLLKLISAMRDGSETSAKKGRNK